MKFYFGFIENFSNIDLFADIQSNRVNIWTESVSYEKLIIDVMNATERWNAQVTGGPDAAMRAWGQGSSRDAN